jgi:hypothetical protein
VSWTGATKSCCENWLLALVPLHPTKDKGQRFSLDCKPPSVALNEFLYHENRFATIKNNYPEKGEEFLALANTGVQRRWETIEALKGL